MSAEAANVNVVTDNNDVFEKRRPDGDATPGLGHFVEEIVNDLNAGSLDPICNLEKYEDVVDRIFMEYRPGLMQDFDWDEADFSRSYAQTTRLAGVITHALQMHLRRHLAQAVKQQLIELANEEDEKEHKGKGKGKGKKKASSKQKSKVSTAMEKACAEAKAQEQKARLVAAETEAVTSRRSSPSSSLPSSSGAGTKRKAMEVVDQEILAHPDASRVGSCVGPAIAGEARPAGNGTILTPPKSDRDSDKEQGPAKKQKTSGGKGKGKASVDKKPSKGKPVPTVQCYYPSCGRKRVRPWDLQFHFKETHTEYFEKHGYALDRVIHLNNGLNKEEEEAQVRENEQSGEGAEVAENGPTEGKEARQKGQNAAIGENTGKSRQNDELEADLPPGPDQAAESVNADS